MELVQGLPITDYCDRHKLTTRERLELFIQVCRAVQHAHQKAIIHRDLKPSNILVAEIDGAAVPKVIDFGIAKAIGHKLSEQTIYTQFSQLVGTPLYMSPEQAGLGVVDVDTRSDVYSLGVLLFELFTGSTPLDKETMKQAGYEEMRRIVREEEPQRPSARISTLKAEQLTTLSDQRGIDPRKYSHALSGELDWIVMRALEKDRTRRYESASAFAADIERYLRDEPVEACPPSAAYRLSKLVRRNKAVLTTVATVILTILVGLTISTVLIVQERNDAQLAAQNAKKEYKRAELNRERLQENLRSSLSFISQIVLQSSRSDTNNTEDFSEQREGPIVQQSLEFFNNFLKEDRDDPASRLLKGMGYVHLAALYFDLGDFDKADQAHTLAVETFHQLTIDSPTDHVVWVELAESHGEFGRCLHARDRYDLANDQCHMAIKAYRHALKLSQHETDTLFRFARFLVNSAATKFRDPQQAVRLLDEAIQLDPENESLWLSRTQIFINQGRWQDAANDFAKAIELKPDSFLGRYEHALTCLVTDDQAAYRNDCRIMLEKFANDSTKTFLTAWICALVPHAVGDDSLAERAISAEPKDAFHHHCLGAILYRAGRFQDALQYLNEFSDSETTNRTSTAYSLYLLAMTHHRLGHDDEARDWLNKANQQSDLELNDTDSPAPWNRIFTLDLFRTEAEALIGNGKGPNQEDN